MEIHDEEFVLLKNYLYKISGIDVPNEKRYLFKTRLAGFLQSENYPNFREFYNKLVGDEHLGRYLIEAMTTNETSFFRDIHVFHALSKYVLPEIIARRVPTTGQFKPTIRILSAGCSFGQEAYSIAMSICEFLKNRTDLSCNNFRILGIDISSRVLQTAQRAVYPADQLNAQIPPAMLHKHFTERVPGRWTVNDEIKNMTSFKEVNLAETLDFLGSFDIVFCRNVMIYFSKKTKQTLLKQFHKMISPNGALFLGSSETTYMLSDDFESVYLDDAICYKPHMNGKCGDVAKTEAVNL